MAAFSERPHAARLIAIAAVAALTLGVGVLSALALQHGSAVPDSSGTPSFTPPPATASAAPAPSPTSSTPAPPVAAAASAERFLAVRDDGILWRGVAGSCGDVAPLVERSSDDGATWRVVTPTQLAKGQLLALSTFGEPDADAVGVGADCVAAGLRTYTDGAQWAMNGEAISSAAYALPARAGSIATPAGVVEAPCAEPSSVRTSRGEVGLICDTVAYRLVDDEWVELAGDAIALDALAGELVVAHGDAECAGVAITRYAAGDPTLLGCIDGAALTSPAALSVVGDEAVLWSGDALSRL